MITLHPIIAGSGIGYLLATVASEDVELGAFEGDEQWEIGADSPGEWVGRAARWLELEGEVTREQADALFKRGVHPKTGAALGARWPGHRTVEERYQALLAKEPNASEQRRAELRARAQTEGDKVARSGWEMVFTPVKSFTVLWGLSDDEGRRRLERIEARAFRKVLERIETEAVWVRLGPAGAVQEQGEGMVGAVFLHRSSRAGDPGLHRHLAISSKIPFDGRWLALDARPLHRMAVTFSEYYTAQIERDMAAEYGITAQPRPGNLADKRTVREFRGVPPRVIAAFSSRRRQTERTLSGMLRAFYVREGREPTRAEQYRMAQVATLKVRPAKHPRTADQERASWHARARALGLPHPQRLLSLAQAASQQARAQAEADRPALHQIPGLVIDALERHHGIWTQINAEAEVIRQLTASGWHIALGDRFDDRIRRITQAVIGPAWCEQIDAPELVSPPAAYLRRDGTAKFREVASTRYSSHRILAEEQCVLAAAFTPAALPRLDARTVDEVLAAGERARGFAPTGEQRDLVRALFAADRRVKAVIGRAGTGKTTLMGMVKQIADTQAIEVLGLTRSQVQAGQLAKATGIRTENIAKWRFYSEQFAPGDPQWSIPHGAIVIMDEAAQASTPDIAAILRQVAAADGRLILVGDPLQLGAIGAGGLLAHLQTDGQALYLTENRRFRDAGGRERTWEIDAAHAVALGRAQQSFAAYDARGRIHAGGRDTMLDTITAAYLRDLDDGLAGILIGPDNATTAVLSDRVRSARIAAGNVRAAGRTAPLGDANTAAVGDIVETRKNDSRIRTRTGRGYVLNGDLWTVLAVDRDGSLTVKHMISGARARLHNSYVRDHVALGYAITKDRAQGVTADTGHALITAQMTRNALYPAITRGRRANHVYLDTGVHIDPDTGEPQRELTARQLWARVLSRDAAQRTTLMTQREAWNEIGTLATLHQRLRHTIEDLRDGRLREQIEQVQLAGADLGPILAAWPAWPALRDALVTLERAGLDPVAILDRVIEERDIADVDDLAAVLHYRIGAHEEYAHILNADPDAAATGAPSAAAGDGPEAETPLLDQLGLRLPADGEGTDKALYARHLADATHRRASELRAQALAQAATGDGWTRAYGPPPEEESEAGAWLRRLVNAALYRDLSGHADDEGDPVGPAPTARDYPLRRIWRDALPDSDPAARRAAALALAATGARWLDALGPAPASADPLYEPWMRALLAVIDYRSLWSYEREDVAIGAHPRERVQAADWTVAHQAIAALRSERATPGQIAQPLTDTELERTVGRGGAAAADASAAQRARTEFYRLAATTTAAHQSAHDAVNRAVAASRAAQAATAKRERRAADAHAYDLWAQALAATDRAHEADLALAEVKQRHRRYVPDEVANRAAAGLGQAALAEQIRRADDQPHDVPQHWTERTFGPLSDQQLAAAHDDALDAARAADDAAERADPAAATLDEEIEQAARQLYPQLAARQQADPADAQTASAWDSAVARIRDNASARASGAQDLAAEMAHAAESARSRAAGIRRELRTRALMEPARRDAESQERTDRPEAREHLESDTDNPLTSSITSAYGIDAREDRGAQIPTDRSPKI